MLCVADAMDTDEEEDQEEDEEQQQDEEGVVGPKRAASQGVKLATIAAMGKIIPRCLTA